MRHIRLLLVSLSIVLSACGGVDGDPASTSVAGAAPTTATEVTQTTEVTAFSTLDVSGTYQFVGEEVPNTMKGTITFEQEGDLVRVTGTKYENNPSRELKGEATIKGTRLKIVLVPINDDPTYEAEVLFIFSEDGDTFEVSFMDTNGDEGDMGSYTGVRQ